MTFDAWVIFAESSGSTPRPTDNPFFPWAWREVIAVLPPTATRDERSAALVAVQQTTHFVDGDRSDVISFADPEHQVWNAARGNYLDALHPYLTIARARNLRYVEPASGESRGRIEYDLVHDA